MGRAQTSRWLIPILSIGLLGACDKRKADEKADDEKADDEKTDGKEPIVEPDAVTDAAASCADKVPNFTDSSVPTAYGGTLPANGADLAVFAWQHFVALGWQSASAKRGKPDTAKSFFDNPTLPVWLSYRHRNEQFPANNQPNPDYNAPPAYDYTNISGPCDSATDTNPNVINNLDEASQLNLDYMFAKPTGATEDIQVLFEAKVNEANYTYILNNKLYDPNNQTKYEQVNVADLAKYGAICQTTEPDLCSQDIASATAPGYCLPCDDSAGNEGTIHVKAAWRQLTDAEAKSGHFFTAPVVLYKVDPKDDKKVCYSNASGETWGLIGLHIIHKTQQFPAFVFASWEHVENEQTNLSYENTTLGGPTDTVGKRLPWKRASHEGQSLPSAGVQAVNTCTQNAIAAANKDSVWQYYQLIGVQGTPVDLATPQTDLPDFYLANNVIESNDFFQTFSGNQGIYHDASTSPPPQGTGPFGTTPGPNIAVGGNTNINDGGCQGCHGNAQRTGSDMSFLGATFASQADAIGEFERVSTSNAHFHAVGG